MTSATVSNPPDQRPAAATPTVSSATLARLPLTAAVTVVSVGAVTAGTVLVSGRADWWPAFVAAFVIAAIAAATSVVVLGLARGRTVDWLVTLTMAATLARMAVSGAGILIAIKGLRLPPEATAFAVCGYYAAMLIAETTLLNRATRPATALTTALAAGGNEHA